LRFSPILAARERTRGGTWRVACRPGVADALGRAFVLGTAVAEAVAEGAIELRTVADEPDVQRILFASPDRIDAVVGPEKDRTLVTEEAPKRVTPAGRAVRERFAAATPETVDMPARSRLLAAACETLDDRFADDVAAVLDAPRTARSDGPVRSPTGRSSSRWRRATITCCGTCGGGSATEQTGSAEGVGIAAGQDLTDDRRALVRRGLIEAIKMPAGDGRPQLRLRAVDDALLRATPEEVLSVLRGRFALPVDEDGRVRQPPGRDERRPVWERTRRDKN